MDGSPPLLIAHMVRVSRGRVENERLTMQSNFDEQIFHLFVELDNFVENPIR